MVVKFKVPAVREKVPVFVIVVPFSVLLKVPFWVNVPLFVIVPAVRV
jgi:hypothetical protein